MRTPEEIKKGLECYQMHDGDEYVDCSHCPYYLTCTHCDIELHKDALAYIKQLEEDRKERDILAEAYQELEANQPKWISVEERLPKHKQVVLAYVDPCLEIVQLDAFDEMWKTDVGWFKLDSVTHWMPLPAPPKEDE